MKRIMIIVAVACAGMLAGPAYAQNAGPGAFDIDSLLQEHQIVKGQPMRSDVIAWDSASSIHLTQIETSAEMHHHVKHDENVWIIRGSGRLTLGDQKLKVKAGQVIHIPRGTSHSFHNLGSSPAVVFSVFYQGFDGKDRIYDD
jgi:mannose-6-phosphate isomerase-like protein (cupin superfamily)